MKKERLMIESVFTYSDKPPSKFDDFIKWFQDKAKLYEGEARENLEINIEAEDDRYGCCWHVIEFVTSRAETDQEIEAKIKAEKKSKDSDRKIELETLAYLKEKYE